MRRKTLPAAAGVLAAFLLQASTVDELGAQATANGQPAPSAAAAGTVRGRVMLAGAGGKLEPSAADAVVSAAGVRRTPRAATPPPPARMASQNKQFGPRIVVVPAGDPVDFPNLDNIYHNVFSLTEGNRFDLGLYKNGDSRRRVFAAPGACRVYCNIHSNMAGIVYVTDGDAAAVTGPDGTFRIDGVPAGPRTFVVWHEKAGEMRLTVDVAPGRETVQDFRLDISGYKDASHLDKHGRPYGVDDEARY